MPQLFTDFTRQAGKLDACCLHLTLSPKADVLGRVVDDKCRDDSDDLACHVGTPVNASSRGCPPLGCRLSR